MVDTITEDVIHLSGVGRGPVDERGRPQGHRAPARQQRRVALLAVVLERGREDLGRRHDPSWDHRGHPVEDGPLGVVDHLIGQGHGLGLDGPGRGGREHAGSFL